MSRHSSRTEHQKFLAVSLQLKLHVLTFFSRPHKRYTTSYRSNFVIDHGHLPLYLVQGAPWKVMAPANPSWRSPHCCYKKPKWRFGSNDCAMLTLFSHGGRAGRMIFSFLAEVHIFIEATKCLDLIFFKTETIREGKKTKIYFFRGHFSSDACVCSSTLERARQARDS